MKARQGKQIQPHTYIISYILLNKYRAMLVVVLRTLKRWCNSHGAVNRYEGA